MTSVPLNAPGATKSIRLSQLYLGESVSTRLNRPTHRIRKHGQSFSVGLTKHSPDLHNTVLILTNNGTPRMLHSRPIAVIEFHNIVDDWRNNSCQKRSPGDAPLFASVTHGAQDIQSQESFRGLQRRRRWREGSLRIACPLNHTSSPWPSSLVRLARRRTIDYVNVLAAPPAGTKPRRRLDCVVLHACQVRA